MKVIPGFNAPLLSVGPLDLVADDRPEAQQRRSTHSYVGVDDGSSQTLETEHHRSDHEQQVEQEGVQEHKPQHIFSSEEVVYAQVEDLESSPEHVST